MTSAHEVAAIHFWSITWHDVESDDAQRLVLSIDTQEVQEGNRALQRSLSDESYLLATLEQRASHVLVDGEQDFRENFIITSDIDGFVPLSSYVIHFRWTACVRAPKFFQIQSTKWNVLTKHTVNLFETFCHDGYLVSFAAKRSISVQKWANLLDGSVFYAGLAESHRSIAIESWIVNRLRIWAG